MSKLFEKYDTLQKNFRKYKEVVKAVGEDTEDATLKKMLETSKAKILSTAEELKKTLDKLVKSNEVNPELEANLKSLIEKLKEKAPKASFGPINKEVKVVEDPRVGLIIYFMIQFLVKEGDKSLYLTALMKHPDRMQNYQLWFDKVTLDLLSKEAEKFPYTFSFNVSDNADRLAAALAKNGFTTDDSSQLISEIKRLLESLHFKGQDDSDKVEMSGKTLSRDFRHYGFFEPRFGEEDDDHPNFTDHHKVMDIVKNHFGSLVDKVKIEVYQQEKGWFTVSITVKN